jgi:hypothetical protein
MKHKESVDFSGSPIGTARTIAARETKFAVEPKGGGRETGPRTFSTDAPIGLSLTVVIDRGRSLL